MPENWGGPLIGFICRLFIAQLLSPQVGCCLFLTLALAAQARVCRILNTLSLAHPLYNYEELTSWSVLFRAQNSAHFSQVFRQSAFPLHLGCSSPFLSCSIFLSTQSKITDRTCICSIICMLYRQMGRLRRNHRHSSCHYDQNSVCPRMELTVDMDP